MKKQIVILSLILWSSIFSWGQNQDYVILKSTESSKIDTVFGEIIFPKNGIIIKAKILTPDGIKKYSPNNVIGFRYGEKYFASVPYNSRGNVFAERIIHGKIDLCYYDTTNPNGYNGGLAGVAATALTSYYFIKSALTDNYLKVPHSREKAKEEISALFKDNEKISNQISSEEFRVWELPKIVKQYNEEK